MKNLEVFVEKHMGSKEAEFYRNNVVKNDFRNFGHDISCFDFAQKLEKIINNCSLEELKPIIPRTKEEALSLNPRLRFSYIPLLGFSLINLEYVDKLADFLKGKKVLEVMSGNGILSVLLKEREVDIIATDIAPGEMNHYDIKNLFNKDIEEIDAVEAIKKYGKDVDYVLMSWPPYANDIASKVMKAIYEVNNELKVIYIGEDFGGCTADDDFFDMIENVVDDSFYGVIESYSRWRSVYDCPRIIKNKKD